MDIQYTGILTVGWGTVLIIPIISGIGAFIGTWIREWYVGKNLKTMEYEFNTKLKSFDYKNAYYAKIMDNRISAIEDIGELLHYFDRTQSYNTTQGTCSYFPWLENKEDFANVIEEFHDLYKETIWLSIDLADELCELINMLIAQNSAPPCEGEFRIIQIAEYTSKIRERSNSITGKLYEELKQGYNIEDFLQQRKDVQKNRKGTYYSLMK